MEYRAAYRTRYRGLTRGQVAGYRVTTVESATLEQGHVPVVAIANPPAGNRRQVRRGSPAPRNDEKEDTTLETDTAGI